MSSKQVIASIALAQMVEQSQGFRCMAPSLEFKEMSDDEMKMNSAMMQKKEVELTFKEREFRKKWNCFEELKQLKPETPYVMYKPLEEWEKELKEAKEPIIEAIELCDMRVGKKFDTKRFNQLEEMTLDELNTELENLMTKLHEAAAAKKAATHCWFTKRIDKPLGQGFKYTEEARNNAKASLSKEKLWEINDSWKNLKGEAAKEVVFEKLMKQFETQVLSPEKVIKEIEEQIKADAAKEMAKKERENKEQAKKQAKEQQEAEKVAKKKAEMEALEAEKKRKRVENCNRKKNMKNLQEANFN